MSELPPNPDVVSDADKLATELAERQRVTAEKEVTERSKKYIFDKKKGLLHGIYATMHDRPKTAAFMTVLGLIGGGLAATAFVPGLAPVGQVLLEIGRQFGATLAGIGASISRLLHGSPGEKAVGAMNAVADKAIGGTSAAVNTINTLAGANVIADIVPLPAGAGQAVELVAQNVLQPTLNNAAPAIDQLMSNATAVKKLIPGL
ncbi:MAG: hypothetical protein WC775_05510 [Patescibacteria group bacterium]|jgi:hypothetical protein